MWHQGLCNTEMKEICFEVLNIVMLCQQIYKYNFCILYTSLYYLIVTKLRMTPVLFVLLPMNNLYMYNEIIIYTWIIK